MSTVDLVALCAWVESFGCWPLIELNGKRPRRDGWQHGPRDEPDVWRGYLVHARGNVGLLTGRLRNGWYLVVLDCDLYVEGAADFVAELFARGLPRATVTVLTPRGGEHLYFLSRVPIASRTLTPGVEIKCGGRQVAFPPSIGANGRPYEHEHGYALGEHEIVELDDAGVALLGGPETAKPRTSSNGADANARTLRVLEEHYGAHDAQDHGRYVTVVRPGKDARDGHSATIGEVGPGVAHVFSDGWPPLEADGNYNERELCKLRGLRDPAAARLQAIADRIPPAPNGVVFRRADTITIKPVEWLYDPYLPLSAPTLLSGIDGIGKSHVSYDFAASATRGALPGNYEGIPVTVAIASSEDGAERVIVPKLVAAGADLARVHLVTYRRHGYEGDLALPDDVPELVAAIEQFDVRLLIIDPLVAHLPGDVDSHKAQHVRRALAPISRMCETRNMAVIAQVHFNDQRSLDPRSRVGGSKAFRDLSRSALIIGHDPTPGAHDTYALVQAKNSFGPRYPKGRIFRVVTDYVHTAGMVIPVKTSRIKWGEEVEMTAADVIRGPQSAPEPTARDKAEAFLLDRLRVAPEHRARATDLVAAATATGLSEPSLHRARNTLGLTVERAPVEGQRGPGISWWILPAEYFSDPATE